VVKVLLSGSHASSASPHIAERLCGCGAGTILPISLNPDLKGIVDLSILNNDDVYLNAARLDRSIALSTCHYLAVTALRLERIATENRE
jgi:Ala-tRNA(Pro) deacylase